MPSQYSSSVDLKTKLSSQPGLQIVDKVQLIPSVFKYWVVLTHLTAVKGGIYSEQRETSRKNSNGYNTEEQWGKTCRKLFYLVFGVMQSNLVQSIAVQCSQVQCCLVQFSAF